MKYKKYSKYSIENPEVWVEAQESDAPKDIKFLIKLFKKYGKVKTVLDVGCGMGAHVKELSDKDYSCVGVDANPAMIKFAKDKYPEIKFGVQKMQTLNLKDKYDAIIFINSILVLNKTNKDILKTLKALHKHLKKKGIAIIEIPNGIAQLQKYKFPLSFVDTGKDRTKLGIKAKYYEYIDEKEQSMISTRTFYTLKGNKKVGSYSKESRLFFPQEIKFFLEQAGFEVLDFYSGDLSELTFKDKKLDKSRLLIVARKK